MSRSKIIALLLPLSTALVVGLLIWTGEVEPRELISNTVRLRVIPADTQPQTEHTLSFEIDLGKADPCTTYTPSASEASQSGDVCVCLVEPPDAPFAQRSFFGTCNVITKQCGLVLKGRCEAGHFKTGLEQYRIDERYASVIQNVPQNSSIELALDEDGTPEILSFMVGDVEIEDYAEEVLAAQNVRPEATGKSENTEEK